MKSASTLDELARAIVHCRRCPRLVAYREEVARTKRRAFSGEEYWGRPVPGFGDPQARLVVVGLAPGAHGANRTGRIFTGDGSGDFLIPALFRAGLANQPLTRHRSDGLELRGAYLTAVVRCAPPDNRPTPQELANCRPYLERELELLSGARVFLALGHIAFDGCLDLLQRRGVSIPRPRPAFAHGAVYRFEGSDLALVASYHPSRQNTQTGRLTAAMFDEVLKAAIEIRT